MRCLSDVLGGKGLTMIDEDKLETLRKMAGRRGVLTTDDVREILPIEHMSADEVATVVLRLEEAGVTIELGEDLIGASRRRATTTPETPVIDLPGGQTPTRDSNQSPPAPGIAPEAYAAAEPIERLQPGDAGAWKFVAAAGAIIAAGAAALLFLLR